MKKMMVLLLCLLLCAAPFCNAFAQSAQRAALSVNAEDFEHYPSWQLDEESGRWSVQANQADALVERFWNYGTKYGTQLCVFYVAVEGDARTGVWSPVLRCAYFNGRDLNATAVSVLVDGVRYDLAASSAFETRGRSRAEIITAPLTAEAVEMVKAMIGGADVRVRLLGDEVYTLRIDRETTAQKRQVEAASMDGLQAALTLLEEAGLNSYALWDLSADAWETLYGFRPAYSCETVETMVGEEEIDDAFGMILAGDRSAAARLMQQALKDSGFMSGTVNETFTQAASAAARRAQQYLGRIQTGCMDVALMNALTAGRCKAEQSQPALLPLADAVELAVSRWWFAGGVSASCGTEGLRAPANSDNLLLAADGWIRSLSPETLYLFMQMEAQLVYNDTYRYEAEIVCECNEGTALDTVLLPMAQARLVAYAEVPSYLAQDEQAQWCMEFTLGGETLSFDLQ